MPGGVYYGKNRESKNLCIGNRKLPRESVIYKITDTNAHDKFSMEHTQSSQMNSNGI